MLHWIKAVVGLCELGGVWITLKSQRFYITLIEREGDKGALPPHPHPHCFSFVLLFATSFSDVVNLEFTILTINVINKNIHSVLPSLPSISKTVCILQN